MPSGQEIFQHITFGTSPVQIRCSLQHVIVILLTILLFHERALDMR